MRCATKNTHSLCALSTYNGAGSLLARYFGHPIAYTSYSHLFIMACNSEQVPTSSEAFCVPNIWTSFHIIKPPLSCLPETVTKPTQFLEIRHKMFCQQNKKKRYELATTNEKRLGYNTILDRSCVHIMINSLKGRKDRKTNLTAVEIICFRPKVKTK